MPFQRNGVRDYKREAEWEKERARHRLRDRIMRVVARRYMLKKGKVRIGDNKQVDHIKPLVEGGTNSPSNWRVVPAKVNLEKEARRKQRG